VGRPWRRNPLFRSKSPRARSWDAEVCQRRVQLPPRRRHHHIPRPPIQEDLNVLHRPQHAVVDDLTATIALILEDRRKDGLRGVPAKAAREKVIVG
jgi:hypothetical protein